MWMTTMLRVAGPLTPTDADDFAAVLSAASRSSELVLVDLTEVGRLPDAFSRAMQQADVELTLAGGALLVVDPDARHELPRQLLRAAVEPPVQQGSRRTGDVQEPAIKASATAATVDA